MLPLAQLSSKMIWKDSSPQGHKQNLAWLCSGGFVFDALSENIPLPFMFWPVEESSFVAGKTDLKQLCYAELEFMTEEVTGNVKESKHII